MSIKELEGLAAAGATSGTFYDDEGWIVGGVDMAPLMAELVALLRLARAVAAEKAAARAMDEALTDAAYVAAQARYNRAALDTAAALAALEEPSP